MQFQIFCQVEGRNFEPVLDKITGEPMLLDDAAMAATLAKTMSASLGRKYQPRPVNSNPLWREREEARFLDGSYQPVVWENETWWKDHHVAHHYAHISQKDPTRAPLRETTSVVRLISRRR